MTQQTPAPSRRASARMGRPSARQSRDKMQEVLRVARAEFVRRGYRATTMDMIAAEAKVAKRTLYLWHKDKSALFLACVLEGAQRFPALSIDPHEDIEIELREYATALVRELAAESSYGMGALILREGAEFPELAAASDEAQRIYLIEPLAEYLRRHGLERADSCERTKLLIAMMLAEVHAALLASAPSPDPAAAERQSRLAVDLFLRGGRAIASSPTEEPS